MDCIPSAYFLHTFLRIYIRESLVYIPDEKFVTEAKAKMGADADAILAKVIAKKEKHRDNAAKGKA